MSSSCKWKKSESLSISQSEVEDRKCCYLESLVKGHTFTDWLKQHPPHSFLPQGYFYLDIPELGGEVTHTICSDILYDSSTLSLGCDNLPKEFELSSDDVNKTTTKVFIGIARMELAARCPELSSKLFVWGVEPFSTDNVTARVEYWDGLIGEYLEQINLLKDTADFGVNYILRLLYLYGKVPDKFVNAPWIDLNKINPSRIIRNPLDNSVVSINTDPNFSELMEDRVKDPLLEFKYWIDEPFFVQDEIKLSKKRKENKWNDKDIHAEMTYWSENHQILFATAEYLAGQLWPTEKFSAGRSFRTLGGRNRTNDYTEDLLPREGDLTGEEHMKKAKVRIIRWLRDRLRFGFCEWNSTTYYEFDIVALLNLIDFCIDERIHTLACMVLDLLIFDIARFSHDGMLAATAGRAYFDSKSCRWNQSIGDVIEILFGKGGGIYGGASPGAGTLATCRRYDIPDVLISIGRDELSIPLEDFSRVSINFEEASKYKIRFDTDDDIMFWWSRGAYLTERTLTGAMRMIDQYRLNGTEPFKSILDTIRHLQNPGKGTRPLTWFVINNIGIDLLGEPDLFDLINDTLSAPDDVFTILRENSFITEGSALTRANLYTFHDKRIMLSSVQCFRPGLFNAQGQFCQATLSKTASVFITHPLSGIYDDLGIISQEEEQKATHDGPNWWTGSIDAPLVIQKDKTAIIAFNNRDYHISGLANFKPVKYTHIWFPRKAFDGGEVKEVILNEGATWHFGQVKGAYIAVFTANGSVYGRELVNYYNKHNADKDKSATILLSDEFGIKQENVKDIVALCNLWRNEELLSGLKRNIYIIQMGDEDEYHTFDEFINKVLQNTRVEIQGIDYESMENNGNFVCKYKTPQGNLIELNYNQKNAKFNRANLELDNFPRFRNKYVYGGVIPSTVQWDQYDYQITHEGFVLNHDFRDIRNPIRYGDGLEQQQIQNQLNEQPLTPIRRILIKGKIILFQSVSKDGILAKSKEMASFDFSNSVSVDVFESHDEIIEERMVNVTVYPTYHSAIKIRLDIRINWQLNDSVTIKCVAQLISTIDEASQEIGNASDELVVLPGQSSIPASMLVTGNVRSSRQSINYYLSHIGLIITNTE